MPILTIHQSGYAGNRIASLSWLDSSFDNLFYGVRRFSIFKQFHHRNTSGNPLTFRSAMAEGNQQPHSISSSQHVVICGGGVIGVCTAYFLAKKGAQVTVVEKTAAACAASGKAGGFLALDWCDGGPLGNLARASFQLHAQLANVLDGESYGYRRVDTLSVSIDEKDRTDGPSAGRVSPPEWVNGAVKAVKPIGSTKTTAQVHPELFTKKILSTAVEKYGAKFVIGEAQELQVELDGTVPRVRGLYVDGGLIEADSVVIAMGPWSATNKLVSALTTISPLKAHSIVLRPKPESSITPHTLFLTYKTKEGVSMDPEVYPRPTGEVYICGMSEETTLPATADQIVPKKQSIDMLKRVAASVSTHLAEAEMVTEQACFLPCSEDSLPVIGKLPNVEGAFVATGHSCWGILNAPATGAALAELIADGAATSVDLKAFDPARFCNPVTAYFGLS
ncbi:hypothetical protein R1flu_004576 [Riccia fluitans]|uniref:FAD dependent oxidoreductase domain-containing protein n=1 Tax=Riccia fluitans TaxID=41844 RepID=A0ABD1YUQ6_9MARC